MFYEIQGPQKKGELPLRGAANRMSIYTRPGHIMILNGERVVMGETWMLEMDEVSITSLAIEQDEDEHFRVTYKI